MHSTPRTLRKTLAALAGAGLAASTLGTAAAAPTSGNAAAPAPAADDTYIVILSDEPVATYEGGKDGLDATKPAPGERLDFESDAVKEYTEHLKAKQSEVSAAEGVDIKVSTQTVLNSFAANLTADQVRDLESRSDVTAVVRNQFDKVSTTTSPEFLGLNGGNGAWRKYGIPRKAGEGVVVGIIDSGINPVSASFRGRPMASSEQSSVNRPWIDADNKTHMLKSDGTQFNGICEVTEDGSWTKNFCTDKLIAARAFGALVFGGIEEVEDYEYRSTRDANSHGSHVASTAAGNYGVSMTVDGKTYGRGSGMAPAAKIAAYKACWDYKVSHGGCATIDTVLAIDAATRDGVDVINYSISGSRDETFNLHNKVFMNAAAAGIFVAAAAGNSGPKESTVAHNTPWITTVAASNFKNDEGTVVDGNGKTYLGVSINETEVPQTPAVMARDIPAEGVEADDAALCKENTLDAEKAAGKVVVCDRGEIARVDKSKEAARAGAVASVLRNMAPGGLNGDKHSVPTVHVDVPTGAAIGEYVNGTENPTLGIQAGNTSDTPSPAVPSVAGFSSRGPALAADSGLLKPDISAPGVGVLAAMSEPNGEPFGFMSGTSMASPHVAGLAALIYGKHPKWTPATIKSAMMTTSRDVLNADGSVNTDNFGTGAGLVDPTKFYEPGLVYDAGLADWLGFAKFNGAEGLEGVTPVRTIDVNMPSFAVPALGETETVTRRVTSMQAGTWTANANVPGIDVTVTPSTLTFDKAGETKEFTVTFKRTDATAGEYTHGELTWVGPGNDVRSPVAVRYLEGDAPAPGDDAAAASVDSSL